MAEATISNTASDGLSLNTSEGDTLTPDDAVDVLEELLPAQNKSYELGLKLKLPQHVVEAIHATYSNPRSRLLYVLIEFTNQEMPRGTWRVIVKTLRSPVVNLPALAKKIEAVHIADQIQLPVPAYATNVTAPPASIDSEIENLEDKFLQLACETRAALSDKEKQDKQFLHIFADFLLNFPVSKKVIHVNFFCQSEDEILKAKSIQSLFAIIANYCNYCNYEIILHIVKRFGDAKLNGKLVMYCDSLKKFETNTTVAIYLHAISALPDSDICKGFTQMAMKINKPTSLCTLYEIRQLKDSIVKNASVQPYSVYIGSVAKGSVLVQLRIHPDCAQMVFDAITNNTYQTGVTVAKISDNGKKQCTYKSIKRDAVEVNDYASCIQKENKCESCHQLNLKKSVLEKVVKVLESPKVQEMELAKEVREMLSGSRSPRVGSEDLPTTPPRTSQQPHPPSIPTRPIPKPRTKTAATAHPPPIKDSESLGSESFSIHVPTMAERKAMKAENVYASFDHGSDDVTWSSAVTVSDGHKHLSLPKIRELSRQKIEVGESLGSGQYGEVYHGRWLAGRGGPVEVAIKTFSPEKGENNLEFLREADINARFVHPNIVRLYGVVLSDPMAMVLEFLPNGELRHFLHSLICGPKPPEQTKLSVMCLSFCEQIAAGMSYFAAKDMAHRNLTARNILVSEYKVCKVAGFGMARYVEEGFPAGLHPILPVKWTAPEALNFNEYSTTSDVWSFGCVMYEIWSLGHKPFEGYTNCGTLKLVEAGLRLSPPPGCPRPIYSLMMQCWHPDKLSRPSFDSVWLTLLREPSSLLQRREDDSSGQSEAGLLAAPLEAGRHLYPDLQETYNIM